MVIVDPHGGRARVRLRDDLWCQVARYRGPMFIGGAFAIFAYDADNYGWMTACAAVAVAGLVCASLGIWDAQ